LKEIKLEVFNKSIIT